jgi:hypothetical protein
MAQVSSAQPQHTQTKSRRFFIIVGVALGLAGLVALGFLFANRTSAGVNVQQFPNQGSGSAMHLDTINAPHPPYNSNPPTSGWHFGGGALTPGIYNEPAADTVSVHNLEHGMVIIHYRQDLEPGARQELLTLVQSLQKRNPCLIVLPRPVDKLNVPIAVTAWTYLLELPRFDANAITTFFIERVGRGPEQVCPVGVGN